MKTSNRDKRVFKKRWVIPVVSILVTLVVVGVALICVSNVLSDVVNSTLREQTERIDGSFTYDDIDINLWKASANVSGLKYVSDTTGVLSDSLPGYEINVKKAEFKFLRYISYLISKDVKIGEVSLSDINARINIVTKRTEDAQKLQSTGSAVAQGTDSIADEESPSIVMSQKLLEFVATINVNQVKVENASLKLNAIDSDMRLSFDNLYLDVENLGYDFSKSKLTYNDSIYYCALKNLYFKQPDGKYTLTVGAFNTKDAGSVNIERLHHICNVPKERLAIVNGKVPAVWSDICVHNISTSDVNLVRSIIDGYVKLDNVDISGGYLNIYKDDTYPPVKVQRPLQIILEEVVIPLEINRVNVSLDRLNFTEKLPKAPAASIGMNTVALEAHYINNTNKSDIVALLKASMNNGGGFLTLNLRLLKDKDYTWRARLFFENAKMEAFNPFVEQIVGANVTGRVKRLEAYYVGDTLTASGDFLMQYDNLDAKIIKGKSPIEELNKHANTINGIVKLVIPHSNPMNPGDTPKAFKVMGERELYKPYFLFFLSPLFDGLKVTVLAPFYLSRMISSSDYIDIPKGVNDIKRENFKDSLKSIREHKREAREQKRESRKAKN